MVGVTIPTVTIPQLLAGRDFPRSTIAQKSPNSTAITADSAPILSSTLALERPTAPLDTAATWSTSNRMMHTGQKAKRQGSEHKPQVNASILSAQKRGPAAIVPHARKDTSVSRT